MSGFATLAGELERWLIERRNNTLGRPYPNTQGYQTRLQPGGRESLLRAQAVSELAGRVDPTLIALHLSATPLPGVDALPPGQNCRPLAEVRWGCGGGTHEAIIDVGPGTTIQLVADSIEIAAVYAEPPPGLVPIPPVGAELLFRATAVYGSRAGAQSAPTVTFTSGPAALDPALGPVLARVPPFAKSVNVLLDDVTDLRGGAQVLTIEAAPGAGFAAPQQFVLGAAEYPGRYGIPIALAPDAAFVRVTATGGRATVTRLVFELCL